MQLRYETEHVRHVLDYVSTNDLFKFIVAERIRKVSEVVNHISVTQTIRVDTDRAGILVLTTADIKNSFLR